MVSFHLWLEEPSLGSVDGGQEGSPEQGTTGQVRTTSHTATEMSRVEENDRIPERAEGPEATVPIGLDGCMQPAESWSPKVNMLQPPGRVGTLLYVAKWGVGLQTVLRWFIS